MQRRFLFSTVQTSRPHSHKHIHHLLLLSSSLSTRKSIRDDLMSPVDYTIDQSVAAVHLRLDFPPYADMTECAGEVQIRCVRFAAVVEYPETVCVRSVAVGGC
jgi:hypothetical protein